MMWKLIIVSEIVQTHGHLEAYKRIQQAKRLRKVTPMIDPLGDQLALDDILVMSPQSREFQDLRRRIEGVMQTVPPAQRVSLEGASFEDAYIYRWPTE
jgi:hypothetical protein